MTKEKGLTLFRKKYREPLLREIPIRLIDTTNFYRHRQRDDDP